MAACLHDGRHRKIDWSAHNTAAAPPASPASRPRPDVPTENRRSTVAAPALL
ncbi:hypothetical protein GSH05_13430 [Burkholderia pseudomallei]|uniref:Uncharacterized protein n=2 Tax=Burkholderia mallei TaxID=13373 RepID=A0AAX1X9Y1_BURML|nr:hypothetical protein BMAA0080 [Burkholderia mallei ATCC 23344]AUG25758.1 hypothetical protein CXQ84_37075 [Burkholderia pseudomallei]RKO00614.1 hypothetical protein D8O31_06895 [Burkholderia mallei]MBM5652630.1 hypothetical protein [Burkholderia pseudomallei]RKO05121.1 hypothetical protein D8O05_12000 [Burkholderia mallei]